MGRNNMHDALAAERRKTVATAEGRGGMVATASVGAVYDRTFFVELPENARSQTAPTVALRLILCVWALFSTIAGTNQLLAQAPVRLDTRRRQDDGTCQSSAGSCGAK